MYLGLTDVPTVMDSVDANLTTELISTSSNINVTNQIVETSIIPHQGCSAFDYDSISEVDCEVDSETGMYSMI